MDIFFHLRLITGNPIDNVDTHLFDNHNDIGNLIVFCSKCFDCDCLSVSTYEWITKRVTDLLFYEFSCRNGVSLPNTVVNCSDDGLRLAVTIMPNESSCNCQNSITMKSFSTDLTTIATRSTESSSTDLTTIATRSTESSSMDLTTIATRSMESTINTVQHKTKTKGKSY
ncbi:Hypothetical predicted protein [Mytilus galloprovincialis]|uniref:Uncharacterized protein n=1 Tax=Mytilus galloprovincialis TaxID=29158 RepID=A0A8B6C237_MYTGA|nr:Hypothetical predicted protein [Mytilus galloprovincialis]